MDDRQIRDQIAHQAALLLHTHRVAGYRDARRRAMRELTRTWLPGACLPTDLEIRLKLQQLSGTGRLFPDTWHDTQPPTEDGLPPDRFDRYLALLRPLDRVMQPPDRHPEGDVLYHSLQVFELMCEQAPWDEELLTAALLHDVGKGIDPRAAHAAGLSAVCGLVTERTAWLIECLPQAHRLREGTLGRRALRRLSAHESWDDLRCLAVCDSEGRVPGRAVRDVDQAVGYLKSQHEQADGRSPESGLW